MQIKKPYAIYNNIINIKNYLVKKYKTARKVYKLTNISKV